MPIAPNIYIQNATLRFKETVLFNNLNFTIPGGRFSCLLGRSGSGKTTLLRLIANLIPFEQKNTHFQGILHTDNGISLQNNIAYLAQGDILLPWLSAFDNAILGTHLRGDTRKKICATANRLFIDTGLRDVAHKFPHELSGGMRQRVALIRTLLEEKPIVLMDEPFSQLDAITRYELQTLTVKLLKGRTVFLVTHDPFEALRMADAIFILDEVSHTFQTMTEFTTPTPRNPNDTEVMKYYGDLINILTADKAKKT
jgi:putative hydroxymethylpyrimidine transport system ATP-binding protein